MPIFCHFRRSANKRAIVAAQIIAVNIWVAPIRALAKPGGDEIAQFFYAKAQ